jgi:hypothetical protein
VRLTHRSMEKPWISQAASRSTPPARARQRRQPTASADPGLGAVPGDLDSSVMNVSMATVANELGTSITGILTAITRTPLVMATRANRPNPSLSVVRMSLGQSVSRE